MLYKCIYAFTLEMEIILHQLLIQSLALTEAGELWSVLNIVLDSSDTSWMSRPVINNNCVTPRMVELSSNRVVCCSPKPWSEMVLGVRCEWLFLICVWIHLDSVLLFEIISLLQAMGQSFLLMFYKSGRKQFSVWLENLKTNIGLTPIMI